LLCFRMVKVAKLQHASPPLSSLITTNTSNKNDFTTWTLTEFHTFDLLLPTSILPCPILHDYNEPFHSHTNNTNATPHATTSDGKPKNSFTFNNVKTSHNLLQLPFSSCVPDAIDLSNKL
jgi:hypothetical protein